MRRIDRYIASHIFVSIIVVLLIIASLDTVFAFIEQLEWEIKGSYHIPQALWFVCLTLPQRLYEHIPFAALIGCLLGLGQLANNSELVVMRAAGVTMRHIIWSVMKPVIYVTMVGMVIGEYIAPFTDQLAKSQRAIAQGAEGALESKYGHWHREDDTFMHFNAVQHNGVLYGVTQYEFDESNLLQKSSFSKRAIYQEDYWVLEDVTEAVISEAGSEQKLYATKRWDTDLSPQLLSVLATKPRYLPITGLYKYSKYLIEQNINAGTYLLAFWTKLFQPLTTLALVLVAISFIFGPLRETTTGHRIFTGVMFGVVFKVFQDLLGPASMVFGFSPIIAAVVPILVVSFIGVYLLRQVR